MKLEEATAVLRPRGSWEAVDLGCALARRHWGPLLRGWITVALPLWTLIFVVCRQSPLWALFWLQWTKPLLTRQPVFFMSRALFGQAPSAGDFWRQSRINFRGILAALTVKRFALQRPFRLPIIMLEGQRGTSYSQRAAVLSAHGGGSAGGLTFVAQMLEFAVMCAVSWGILKVMHTLDSQWDNGLWQWVRYNGAIPPDKTWWVLTAALAAAIAIVEPFYSAAGFALYINSRTHLEGWDIEVAFRRMSARLAPVAIIVSAALLLFAGGPASAAPPATKREAKQMVEEILKGPDFELEKVQVRERKLKPDDPAKPKPEPQAERTPEPDQRPDLDYSRSGAADFSVFGYAIIASVVVLVGLLLWKNRAALRGRGGIGEEKRAGPRVVMGMNVAPESLPDDIPQIAWREYMEGRPLDALRLLYRGALAWLVNRADVPVHESDTEGDCLRHSQQLPDARRASFFSSLTAAWVNCAYAGLPPGADPMKRLCDHWPFSLRQPATRPGISPAAVSAWLAVPLAALLCAGCVKRGDSGGDNYEYETREEIKGYKGAARMNPWLAAEKFLTKSGTPAETRVFLGEMPAWDATVFLPLDAIASRGEARSILEWATKGGHLIIACSGAGRFHNDYDGLDSSGIDKDSPLLRELRISESAESGEVTDVKFGKTSFRLDTHDGNLLDLERRSTDVLAGTRDAAAIASFDHGMGRITLLAGATPFRNRYLAENDHAAILQNIVALQPSSLVVFVSKGEINLWDMLRRFAWMPLVATILLIIFWLWRHLPRFGRAEPASESGIRHFGTQLDEAGRFLTERAGPGALLAPARRAVITAAAQRGLHPDAPDFMDQLATRSGLTHAEVSAALLDATDKNLTATTAALQKLQQSIGPAH